MKPEKKAAEMTTEELAKYIDYSVLKPEFTEAEIIDLTKDGVALGCATICINPAYMDLCRPYVEGKETKLCPVCDFPFGTSSTESRIAQAKIIMEGNEDIIGELDIVANFGRIRSGKYDEVTKDLKAVADECHKHNIPLKVIFETDALNEEQIRQGCECIIAAGADFIKTSTGFLTGHEAKGAAIEVIELIMDQNKGRAKIKGSGCIRTREHFLKLIDMGIDRMGVGYKSVPVVLDLNR